MDSNVTLDIIFNHVMRRAKLEKCNVNMYGNTIWLRDFGFGFDDEYFCICPKNCDDNDKIARWNLPILKFWQRPKMLIQFKFLVKEIKKRNKTDAEKYYLEKQLEKEGRVKEEIIKLIGMRGFTNENRSD